MKAIIKAILPGWLLNIARKTKRAALSPYRKYKEKKAKQAENNRLVNRYQETYTNYIQTGVVPPDAYQLLTPIYILTKGQLTETMTQKLGDKVPPVPVKDTGNGILPKLTSSEFDTALNNLRRDGLHVFSELLSADVCDALLEYAKTTPCSPRGDHLKPDHPAVPFDPNNPLGPTYWFNQQLMAELPIMQRFLTDPTGLKLAQAYLGLEPILNIHMLWWSAAFKASPDAKSAQSFHFDLDRAKFLKIFVYLVDVHAKNGPHVYVKKSHTRKPDSLFQARRFSDEEILAHYPKEDAEPLTGPRGTIFVADTRGFHKGTPVVDGVRLMFEVEYVCDRFGRSEPVIHLNERFGPEFTNFSKEHPRLFCRFTDDQNAKTTVDLKTV